MAVASGTGLFLVLLNLNSILDEPLPPPIPTELLTMDALELPPPATESWLQPKVTIEEMTAPNVILANNYQLETHSIETKDGYVLTVFRIPNPNKPVVLLQHGLHSSSSDWVVLGRGRALGFLLHDSGYDVWLGNARGNRYSRKHIKLTVKDKQFWDFSFHEIGLYDVPAMIDFALAESKQSSLAYVGHSQGTTAFMVAASMKPEYNKKVSAFLALAPVAYMDHPGTFLRLLIWAQPISDLLHHSLGQHGLQPSPTVVDWIVDNVCSKSLIWRWFCAKTLFYVLGFNEDQIPQEKMLMFVKTVPAGTSVKAFTHYAQVSKSGRFQQFDYGAAGNKVKYGQPQPPEYPLGEISLPVHLYYADQDVFAPPKDVEKLHKILKNVKTFRRVSHRTFNHIDFIFGKDCKELLYDDVIGVIREATAKFIPNRFNISAKT